MASSGEKGPNRLRAIREADREQVREILFRRWGPPGVVCRGRLHLAHTHPGFLVEEDRKIVGLLTYEIRRKCCEVVSLDALRRGHGIGSRLLAAVERLARSRGCGEVWLITTNDNLRALRFYQRRGYRIRTVHAGAIEESRRIKPSISLVGMHGIPLRDEIELCKVLRARSTGSLGRIGN